MSIKNNSKNLLESFSKMIVSAFKKEKTSSLFTKIGLAVASFVGYSVLISWKFALLLMISVGFHESGHVWAMNKIGLKNKGFYFLPFLGGMAVMDGQYKSYKQNIFVFIMGPLWGAFLAWAVAIAYWCTHIPLLASAAMWMAIFNLFNLLPISLLDGGQIIKAIGFSISQKLGLFFMLASVILAAVAFIFLKAGLLILILIFGSLDLVQEIVYRYKQNQPLSKYKITNRHYPIVLDKKQIASAIAAYIGTIIILGIVILLMTGIPEAGISQNFLK